MNRQIVYPGAIPLETDLLNTNIFDMIGLAKLASVLMGGNTYAHGLACTPSSPASMVVNVAPGQIYSLQNIDDTAFSSLPADTTHSILKQGYVLDAQTFTLVAPTTAGYSVNYLIQVAYSDVDGGQTVLPYYNASNPSTAWIGPNNSGMPQSTVRQGVCTVSIKSGVAATTGTQTTPAADTGHRGLHVITVAQGATSVTAANITTAAGAPFLPAGGLVDGIQRKLMTYAPDTGSANAYTAQYFPAVLSITDGTQLEFTAKTANTGASTFNPNGLGAAPVLTLGGTVLLGGEIPAGSQVVLKWNSTLSSWLIVSASGNTIAPTLAYLGLGDITTVGVGKGLAATPGYMTVPVLISGVRREFYIQWGSIGVNVGTTGTITLPIAFPNNTLSALATKGVSINLSSEYTVGIGAFSKTTLQLANSGPAGGAQGIQWFAIGY